MVHIVFTKAVLSRADASSPRPHTLFI